jgi:hypothetical protein
VSSHAPARPVQTAAPPERRRPDPAATVSRAPTALELVWSRHGSTWTATTSTAGCKAVEISKVLP